MTQPDLGRRTIIWPVVGGLFVLWLLIAFELKHSWVFNLDQGAVDDPTDRYGYFAGFSMLFALTAAVLLAVGAARASSAKRHGGALFQHLSRGSEGRWLVALGLLGLGIPLCLRVLLVGEAPLHPLEEAHLFQARLFAEGRAAIPSYPMTEHFQSNPGLEFGDRIYARLPPGWSLLLVPGLWLGRPWLIAPVCAGLGVIPAYWILRRLFTPGWARLGVVLLLLSPMLAMAAATRLNHAASLSALLWMHWFVLQTGTSGFRWRPHLGVAISFSLALAIAPIPALGLGLPLLAFWIDRFVRRPWREAMRPFGVFVLVGIVSSLLWAALNEAQTGDPLIPAFGVRYIEEFSTRPRALSAWKGIFTQWLHWPEPDALIADWGIALFRMNLALFGWALSLAFVPLALLGPRWLSRIWLLLLAGMLVMVLKPTVGHDIFGPANYFELAWPLVILTVAGVREAVSISNRLAQAPGSIDLRAAPLALVLGMFVASWAAYWQPRLEVFRAMANATQTPIDQIEQADLGAAVVFGPRHYRLHRCIEKATTPHMTQPPLNQPALTDKVLWVKDLGEKENKRLMKYFPARTGYVARWTKRCGFKYRPLDELSPRKVIRTPGKPKSKDEDD